MNVETIAKILSIPTLILGLLVLSSNFIDFNYWISKILLSPPKTPLTPKAGKDNEFLEIVDLWYQLRNKCENYELPAALEKLDEVFPLLNDKIEVKNV